MKLLGVPAPAAAVESIRHIAGAGFRTMVSGDPTGEPPFVKAMADGTDIGYFGPDSAAWLVNSHLTALVGGVRALLMQALHPAALTGVMEHSTYERDPLGRLAGTARWIAVTTFGDTAQADRECARVRGMHRRVHGTYSEPDAPKGIQPYSATDPVLLNWVHIAFMDSFLSTYLVWGGNDDPTLADRYVSEWAKAGELVGVTDPPRSVAELDAQVAEYRPMLRHDEATDRIVSFIVNAPVGLAAKPAYGLILAGAIATLRDDHRKLLGFPPVPLTLVKPPLGVMLKGMRQILEPESPAIKMAKRRVARLEGEASR